MREAQVLAGVLGISSSAIVTKILIDLGRSGAICGSGGRSALANGQTFGYSLPVPFQS
ncbi:hypothetical protein M2271_008367 [Streptomyces sp. LBL]|nr:hypothetical protein [Streptomyces sp. LBL]